MDAVAETSQTNHETAMSSIEFSGDVSSSTSRWVRSGVVMAMFAEWKFFFRDSMEPRRVFSLPSASTEPTECRRLKADWTTGAFSWCCAAPTLDSRVW